MIVKIGRKWRVVSEKGRNLGTYNTKKEAEERLRQVERAKNWYRHVKEVIK